VIFAGKTARYSHENLRFLGKELNNPSPAGRRGSKKTKKYPAALRRGLANPIFRACQVIFAGKTARYSHENLRSLGKE
jgi:hypothetical protein